MKPHSQNNPGPQSPDEMLKEAIKKSLSELGEYAECVVIIASTTENKKTYLVADYVGNQFAAEKMAEVFCEHFHVEEESYEYEDEELDDEE
jgi:hypothetical protein